MGNPICRKMTIEPKSTLDFLRSLSYTRRQRALQTRRSSGLSAVRSLNLTSQIESNIPETIVNDDPPDDTPDQEQPSSTHPIRAALTDDEPIIFRTNRSIPSRRNAFIINRTPPELPIDSEEDIEARRNYDLSSDPLLDHSLMESIRPRIFNLSFSNTRHYEPIEGNSTDIREGEISPEERRLAEWRSQSVNELEQLIEARINSRAALRNSADDPMNEELSAESNVLEGLSTDRNGERSDILQSMYHRWQTARHLMGYRNRNARMAIPDRQRLARDSTLSFQSRIPRPSTAGPARGRSSHLSEDSSIRPPTPGLLDDPPEEGLS